MTDNLVDDRHPGRSKLVTSLVAANHMMISTRLRSKTSGRETVKTIDVFQGDFGLGAIIGRRYTLSTLAGRCSAGDAACLREIRDARAYKPRTSEWGEFCSLYLGISKTQANLLIQLLVEFGPDYLSLPN